MWTTIILFLPWIPQMTEAVLDSRHIKKEDLKPDMGNKGNGAIKDNKEYESDGHTNKKREVGAGNLNPSVLW